MIRKPLLERLLSRVERRSDGCWQWTGATDGHGYGRISLGRRGDGHAKAHRVAYEFYVGPIPDGLTIDHLCRNPSCVNPDHLEPVTHRENVLRGTGFPARNAQKTHCKNGHPFDADNTLIREVPGRLPHRQCRTCITISQRAKYYRRKLRTKEQAS